MKNFEIYSIPKHLFVLVASYGVTFSTNTVEILNTSQRVNIYFDSKNKQIVVQADQFGEWRFVTTGKKSYVRWNNKKLMKEMAKIAGLSLEEMLDKKFDGKFFSEENVVIFNFMKTRAIRKKSPD